MKLTYLTFLLLLCTTVVASTENGLIPILDQFNSQIHEPSALQCQSDDDLLQECAASLCGPPQKALEADLADSNFKDYVRPEILGQLKSIDPEVKKFAERVHAGNQKFLEDLQEQIQGQKGVDFTTWKPKEYSYWAEKLFKDHVEVTIDQNKPLAQRLNLNPNYPDQSSEDFKRGLDAYITQSKKDYFHSAANSINLGLYTKTEAQALVQAKWNEVKKKYTEATRGSKKPGIELQNNFKDLKKELSASDGSEDLSLLGFRILSLQSFEDQVGEKIARPIHVFKCELPDCQLAVQKTLTRESLLKNIEEALKANNLPRMIERKTLTCRSYMASLYLADKDAAAFKSKLPLAVSNVLKLGTKGYSDHSLKNLKKHFDEIQFDFPRKESQPLAASEFNQEIKNELGNIRLINPPPKENMADSLVYLHRFEDRSTGKMNPFFDTSACISANDIQNDFYDGEDRKISLSRFTCSHHSHGVANVSHELGHAISYAFRTNKLSPESLVEFKKLRDCSTLNSSFDPGTSLKNTFSTDGKTTEEDTADLIEYLTNKDGPNTACSFLEVSLDKKSYRNLSVSNVIPSDSHSSEMYRVLMSAIHKGQAIPVSCQKVMAANPQFRFEKCF